MLGDLDESVTVEREAIVHAVVAFHEEDWKVFRLEQRRLARREPGNHLSRHPRRSFQFRQYRFDPWANGDHRRAGIDARTVGDDAHSGGTRLDRANGLPGTNLGA